MCEGISLNYGDLPEELIRRHGLKTRIVRRSPHALPEIRFLRRSSPCLLPAWDRRQLDVFRWGNSDGRIPHLPATATLDLETLTAEIWKIPFERIIIPANLGLERGIWYQIREGIEGVIVNILSEKILFMLTEEASHYYQTMTRSDRMPIFVGERI